MHYEEGFCWKINILCK